MVLFAANVLIWFEQNGDFRADSVHPTVTSPSRVKVCVCYMGQERKSPEFPV